MKNHTINILTLAAATAFEPVHINKLQAYNNLKYYATEFGYINMLDATHTVWREQLNWGNGFDLDIYQDILDYLYSQYPFAEDNRPAHWYIIL